MSVPEDKSEKGVRGYVTHSSFGGFSFPAPAQNTVLRDYCARQKLRFLLSVNEFFFPNCYLQFEGMLAQLPSLRGVVMCSLFMLPADTERRAKIYERFIEAGAELHFAFEGIVIRKREDVEFAEEIFKIRKCLEHSPQTV